MEEHDGNQGPLWSFMDDVSVGKPAVVRKQSDQQVSQNLCFVNVLKINPTTEHT